MLYSDDEIDAMDAAGELARYLLKRAATLCVPGATTESISHELDSTTKAWGGRSAPLGYRMGGEGVPFPAACCISVNNELCHGVPSSRVLQSGDVVKVDVTPVLHGWHADMCSTFVVPSRDGSVPQEHLALVQHGRAALDAGIMAVKVGKPINDVGRAISDYLRWANQEYGLCLSIVPEFTGHGTGHIFHQDPYIPHYEVPQMEELLFATGMVFTIEPIIVDGDPSWVLADDEWTVVGKTVGVQWERTLFIKSDGTVGVL